MRSASERAICLLAIAVIIGSFGSSPAQAEVVVQAITANDSRPLGAHEERLQFDGAAIKLLVFQGRNQTLRYAPLDDWHAGTDVDRSTFTKGKVTATFVVRWTGATAPQTSPTPAELQQFAQETFARLRGEGVTPPATPLPWHPGDLTFAESTVVSGLPGQSRVLQRVRSWGREWQIQIEITGPEQEFNKVAPAFLSSLGNMQILSTADLQAETAANEKQARAAAASEASHRVDPDATPAPRTRGFIK